MTMLSSLDIMCRENCKDCKIYENEMKQKEAGELTCCRWFMDNVVCGDYLDTSKCDIKKPIKAN